MHPSSRAHGTRQRGGNAGAGFRYRQDLLLMSFGVITGRPGPAGARSPHPREWRVSGSLELGLGEPSAADNVTLAPCCRRTGQSMADAPREGVHRCPSHSSSAAGHALRARSQREQGPEHQGSQGCPALGLSVWRPVFNTEVHRHLGGRPPLRGHRPLQVLLWVVLWWVRPGRPALLEPL